MSAFDNFPGNAELWEHGPAIERARQEYPEAIIDVREFRREKTMLVDRRHVYDVLALLRDDPDCGFDVLTDVTAVHWPQRAEPFDVVHLLYSMPRNRRLRIKCHAEADPVVPSVVSLWPSANWLERECHDMYGIVFEGHPDLRRILMPDDYDGHPLRKDFPLKR